MTDMTTNAAVNIETLLSWSEPKEIRTSRGLRVLRKAEANETFWQLWRASKDVLKQAGVGVSPMFRQPDKWEVCWWQMPSTEKVEAINANTAASRATDAEIDTPCPDGLAYMPFQRAGIAWCRRFKNTMICDEMGLGKTIQAIGVINDDPTIQRVLVVAPLTPIRNWHRELSKWLTRPMSIGIATGKVFPTADIVLINYDVLVKWPKRLSFFWDLIVLDEAHMIKNRKAKRAQALIGIKPTRAQRQKGVEEAAPIPARRKLILTGTPIENRPDELWALLHFLDPVKWRSYWKFTSKYCGTWNMQVATRNRSPQQPAQGQGVLDGSVSQYSVRTVTQIGEGQNLDRLNRELREDGWMIRRLKKDVITELPAKTRTLVEIEPDEACLAALELEREAEERFEGDFTELEAEVEIAKASDDPDAFKAAVMRMTAAKRIAFDEIARVRHDTAVAKLPACMDVLEDRIEQCGVKLIVFGHHHDVLEPLHAKYPNSVLLTGDTPAGDRDMLVQRFQTDPSCGPFFGSIRACGQAITLTASSHVIFMEEDWVPGRISQAEDRAHRIGQKENVLVEHFVLPGSIDLKMAKTHVRKQEIADKALDDVQAAVIRSTPITLVTAASGDMTRKDVEREAQAIPPEMVAMIHRGLKILAGVCDYAQKRDDCGFNGCDASIGHSFANRSELTPKMAVIGRKILWKYHRQLPSDINEAIREKKPE